MPTIILSWVAQLVPPTVSFPGPRASCPLVTWSERRAVGQCDGSWFDRLTTSGSLSPTTRLLTPQADLHLPVARQPGMEAEVITVRRPGGQLS